jgi:hypothetical protein
VEPPADRETLGPESWVGISAGDNYRFGFKAAGDASALLALGEARGLAVAVVGSISDCGPHCAPSGGEPPDRKISSTRVRQALGRGDMACVEQLLGRPHQLAAWIAGGALRRLKIRVLVASTVVLNGCLVGFALFDNEMRGSGMQVTLYLQGRASVASSSRISPPCFLHNGW